MSSGLDIDELVLVRPEDVSGYLRATGWQDTGGYDGVRVWSRSVHDEDVEVLLPVSNEFRDYPTRLVELLETLADVENRRRDDILRELRDPLVDVQYIRTMPDTPSGTTPLAEGAKSIQGVRELFLAVADKEFVDQVRLGVPTGGSYVLRVETPIGPGPEPGETNARGVLLRLYRSIQAAHTAAVESARVGTPRPFERQLEYGVSARLCGALANIGGNRRSPFEFRFAWAPTVPVHQETPELRFDSEHVVALHDGRAHLAKLADTEPATVVGRPIDLKHRDEPTGRVVIEGRVELPGRIEENRRVVMRVSRVQYDEVVQAHRPGQPALVQVSGLLKATGRQWEMVGIEELRIIR